MAAPATRYAFRRPPRHAPGLRRPRLPLPTRLVSNEEFPPLPQTAAQRAVEDRILADGRRGWRPRLGLSRRDFLRTSGGMATSLLAMNAVFGRFFDVLPVEAADPAAFKERTGDAVLHLRRAAPLRGRGLRSRPTRRRRAGACRKQALLGLRQRSRRLNPKLAADRGTLADLVVGEHGQGGVPRQRDGHRAHLDTARARIRRRRWCRPKEMTHIRDEINRVTQSRRMLAHGLITPQLGQADLDFMDQQAATLKVDAWKGYTGAAPKGFDRGWFVDDEKIAYPMLERARKLGVKRICLHKGLPLGPVADYNHPRDSSRRPATFPDIDFVLYHAGLLTCSRANQSADVPWTTEFCQMKKKEPALTQHLHGARLHLRPARHHQSDGVRAPARARSSTPSAPITCCGAPTRSGTARRSGRSRPSAASRSPTR